MKQTRPGAMELIEEALMLDFKCIEAFEFLGQTVDSPVVARVFFEKGVALGREKFGGNYGIKKRPFLGAHGNKAFHALYASECRMSLCHGKS